MEQSINFKSLEYTFAIGFYVDSITVVKSEINRELEKLKKEGTIKRQGSTGTKTYFFVQYTL